MIRIGISGWRFRVHRAGERMPRLKAYGPRVTGGNPAWEKLGRR